MTRLHARSSDPDTSHAAMAAFDEEKMESAVDLVIHLYRTYGPMADFKLQAMFEATWGSKKSCRHLYQQARSVSRDRGWVVDTGKRVTNPMTNRKQILWEYCDDPQPVVVVRCPTCGKLIGRKKEDNTCRAST